MFVVVFDQTFFAQLQGNADLNFAVSFLITTEQEKVKNFYIFVITE